MLIEPLEDDLTPEDWLHRHDSSPAWAPVWPVSKIMALVCVRVVDDDTEAVVVLSEDSLEELAAPQPSRLFFRVLRSVLYDEGLCDGLCDESFQD